MLFILIYFALNKITMEQNIKNTLSEFAIEIEKDIEFDRLSEHDLLNKWTSKILSISNEFRKESNKLTLKELYSETILSISTPNGNKSLFESIPTGFIDLDRMIRGLPLGELIVLGGRPAMGKTAFFISLLVNMIRSNIPTAYFSVENTSQQIMLRLFSQLMELPYQDLVSNELSAAQIEDISNKTKILKTANVTIEDNCMSIDDIITQVDYLVKEKGLKLVLVDYLQLIKVKGRRENNREADVAKLCRELKGLARKYNVAVMVNSQLSRAVEARGGDKRPQLSDLRESGAIEQDADKVLFLHRPEYYNITEDYEGNSTTGIAELIIAKNREGSIGSVKLNFVAKCSTFKDIDTLLNNNAQPTAEYFKEMRKEEFKENNIPIIRRSKMNDIEEDHPF